MLFVMARNSAMLTKKHFIVLLWIGVVISLYGILQTFGIDPFTRDFIRQNWTRAFSTIGNPNFLGSYLVLLLPFATDYFMRFKHKGSLLIYAILFYTLLATMTRGAWIGAGLSHLIYFALIFRAKQFDKKRFFQYVMVTLVVLVAYSISTGNEFIARLLSIQKDVSDLIDNEAIEHLGSSRMFIWIRGLELVKARPFLGYGLENVGIAFLEFYRSDILNHFNRIVIPDKAHNEFLHVALTTGLFGLLSYLSFLFAIIRVNVRKLFDNEVQLALFIAIIGYLIQAFFNISVVSVAYVFWIFLGLSVNYLSKEDDRT
jgi:putative inorganic carbon (HCO3(-)) transporter